MSCLTFVRCSPADVLVKPFFIQSGDVLDPLNPWTPNDDDLLKLTVNQLKSLMTEEALTEFKPVKKEDYVTVVINTWDDTISSKSASMPTPLGTSGGGDGEKLPSHGGDAGGSDRDAGDEPDGSDGGGSGDDGFGDFSDDDNTITVHVDVRAMFNTRMNPSFHVKTSWAVRYLKMALYGKFGISPNAQRLTAVGGSTIYVQRSFHENNIRDGQTLVLLSSGAGGVKRTAVKEKDETKVLRLKQRVRSDVREVDVREVDTLIQSLQNLREVMKQDFTIQSLLGDADGRTLRQVLDLVPTGLSGKASTSKMSSIIHKLLPNLKWLHENGLATCKDVYQHIYHDFMTDYAENYHTINTSEAKLSHASFKEAVQGMIEMKNMVEKQEVKTETKQQFEQLMRDEIERIREEEKQKAMQMARQMAEEFINSGGVNTSSGVSHRSLTSILFQWGMRSDGRCEKMKSSCAFTIFSEASQ